MAVVFPKFASFEEVDFEEAEERSFDDFLECGEELVVEVLEFFLGEQNKKNHVSDMKQVVSDEKST